jgi:hypothetical protein
VGLTDDVDAVPSEVWVHPAVRVRRSAIAGRGLFIDADVPAETALIRFGGSVVSLAELHRRFAAAAATGTYVDTVAVDEDRHVVMPDGSIAHDANHSCDPSMWLGPPLTLVARHDLDAGAELTSDYGVTSDDPSFEMACRCGTASCRRVVTGTDWQLEELQVRHHGRWPAGLQARIGGVRRAD